MESQTPLLNPFKIIPGRVQYEIIVNGQVAIYARRGFSDCRRCSARFVRWLIQQHLKPRVFTQTEIFVDSDNEETQAPYFGKSRDIVFNDAKRKPDEVVEDNDENVLLNVTKQQMKIIEKAFEKSSSDTAPVAASENSTKSDSEKPLASQ